MYDAFKDQLPDIDPGETQEWIEALDEVIDASPARARFLLHRIMHHARARQIGLPSMVSTDYINTISPEEEPYFPGNEQIESRIRQIIRWNAVVMVMRANKKHTGIGGHLATYASAASLLVSTTSSEATTCPAVGTRCSSKVMVRRGSTHAPSWRAASRKSSWTTSGQRPSATGCLPILTLG
jgi:hypothetical protein